MDCQDVQKSLGSFSDFCQSPHLSNSRTVTQASLTECLPHHHFPFQFILLLNISFLREILKSYLLQFQVNYKLYHLFSYLRRVGSVRNKTENWKNSVLFSLLMNPYFNCKNLPHVYLVIKLLGVIHKFLWDMSTLKNTETNIGKMQCFSIYLENEDQQN